MKLFDQSLELEILKSICSNDLKKASLLLSTLDDSYFYSEIAKNVFQRIKNLSQTKVKVPSWKDILSDISISEDFREVLKTIDKEPLENIDNILKNLKDFRKARIIHNLSEKIQQEILKDKIDIDKLYDELVIKLSEAKSGADLSNCFTKIGYQSNTLEKLKNILLGTSLRYIPTGFKGWDNINQGIPIGKLGILAATSGGGKSLCANQLALNMAMNNVRSCIVPLEMSADDMLHRFLANKTNLDMTSITKAKDLDQSERNKALKIFRAFEHKLAETMTSIDLFNPPEDITMEDLLFLLQPFNYDIIIIDYIGLLKGFEKEDGWRKMMDAVRFAKRWAETTNTAVLILAQLSEDMIIRYSKGMKEHADLMWTWNSGKVNETNGETILKIEPQKGRNQAQCNFYLKCNFKKMSMVDASDEDIKLYESKKKGNKKGKKENKEIEVIKKGEIDNDLYGDL